MPASLGEGYEIPAYAGMTIRGAERRTPSPYKGRGRRERGGRGYCGRGGGVTLASLGRGIRDSRLRGNDGHRGGNDDHGRGAPACFPAYAGMTINYGNDGQLKEGSQIKERA